MTLFTYFDGWNAQSFKATFASDATTDPFPDCSCTLQFVDNFPDVHLFKLCDLYYHYHFVIQNRISSGKDERLRPSLWQ